MFLDQIELLLRQRQIQKKDFLAAINLNKNSFSAWRTRGTVPSGDVLQKIADYFGVSVDYLLSDGADQSAAPSPMTDADLKFALFGGDQEIPDEVLEEVKRFAAYAKEKYGKQ